MERIVKVEDIRGVDANFKARLNIYIAEIKYRYMKEFQSHDFDIELHDGKKYVKIVELRRVGELNEQQTSKSAHSFIEKSTGNIFKPASWRGPAPKEGGNLYNQGGLKAFGRDWQIKYL